MTEFITEQFVRAPSAFKYMTRAILRNSRRTQLDGGFPPLAVRWSGLRIKPSQLVSFQQATGITNPKVGSVLIPHVFGFRLQMALLTHPAYPIPIWRALQIRNRLVRHVFFDPRETMDMETRIGEYRFVDKGVEVDLVSRLTRGRDCCWESSITYFYRGQFGAPSSPAPAMASPFLDNESMVERFRIPYGGRLDFGRLTGDYNGIHFWRWYARRFGFPAALLHPQRVAGMCLAQLQGPDHEEQTLALWIKGPVFYGENVLLRAAHSAGETRFGLSLEGDHRMALAGIWQRRLIETASHAPTRQAYDACRG